MADDSQEAEERDEAKEREEADEQEEAEEQEKAKEIRKVRVLIEKATRRKVPKRKIITFLKKKGISEESIIKAYTEFYVLKGLYEITFSKESVVRCKGTLGFSMMDMSGHTIVSSIQDLENIKLLLGSKIYEINGNLACDKQHEVIREMISQQIVPFYIVFQEMEFVEMQVTAGNVSKCMISGYIRQIIGSKFFMLDDIVMLIMAAVGTCAGGHQCQSSINSLYNSYRTY